MKTWVKNLLMCLLNCSTQQYRNSSVASSKERKYLYMLRGSPSPPSQLGMKEVGSSKKQAQIATGRQYSSENAHLVSVQHRLRRFSKSWYLASLMKLTMNQSSKQCAEWSKIVKITITGRPIHKRSERDPCLIFSKQELVWNWQTLLVTVEERTMMARYRSFHCVSYIYIQGKRRKAKQGLLKINLLFYHLAVFTLICIFPLPAATSPRRRLSSATLASFENAIIKQYSLCHWFQYNIVMEADQAEEKDEIEHYLRALRKKVEHQVRNPFDLAFASFSFEELATWKNNVLQLDATSRLYGQRVDFLHCGALQVLGSVLNNEQAVQQSTQQRLEVKKQQAYDNAPYQKNLEIPQKISCQIERCEVSFTLWREIRKKRDALHQMMLNELPLDNSLGLMLIPQATEDIYEQVFQEDTAVYMKLLDFRVLSLKNMAIYQQIQEVSSSINIFMLNYSGKARGDTTKVDSFMDFDFQYLDQDPFLDMQPQLDEGIRFAEMSPIQLHEEEIEVEEELQSSSQFGESQDYFEFDEESNTGKPKKGPKTNQKRRQKATKKRQQENVDFKGMCLQRNLIILPQTQEIIQKFINPRDFLLLKFVKYGHPYAKKHKKHAASKMRPNFDRNITYQEPVAFQPEPLTCQNPLNETFSWNPVTNISKMSQVRFKEAALPIKQMKRKIREKVVIGPQRKLRFNQIKDAFASDQPLDIFISVLHIAAEEQALIVV